MKEMKRQPVYKYLKNGINHFDSISDERMPKHISAL